MCTRAPNYVWTAFEREKNGARIYIFSQKKNKKKKNKRKIKKKKKFYTNKS